MGKAVVAPEDLGGLIDEGRGHGRHLEAHMVHGEGVKWEVARSRDRGIDGLVVVVVIVVVAEAVVGGG